MSYKTVDEIRLILNGFMSRNIPNDLYKIFILFIHDPLNTVLLNDKQIEGIYQMISNQLNKPINHINLQFLYCATKHGFEPINWHKKVDNNGKTITFILTEHDYIFGGFTSIPWISENTTIHKIDKTAFIFRLTPNIKIYKHNNNGIDAVGHRNDVSC